MDDSDASNDTVVAIGSLRSTVARLLDTNGGPLWQPVDDDLESLSALLAGLVRRREESQRELQNDRSLWQHCRCKIGGYARHELPGNNPPDHEIRCAPASGPR